MSKWLDRMTTSQTQHGSESIKARHNLDLRTQHVNPKTHTPSFHFPLSEIPADPEDRIPRIPRLTNPPARKAPLCCLRRELFLFLSCAMLFRPRRGEGGGLFAGWLLLYYFQLRMNNGQNSQSQSQPRPSTTPLSPFSFLFLLFIFLTFACEWEAIHLTTVVDKMNWICV